MSDSGSTFDMNCRRCGRKTSVVIDGLCAQCHRGDQPTTPPLPANWCPVHGAWACGIPTCPSCAANPPGIRYITTTDTVPTTPQEEGRLTWWT